MPLCLLRGPITKIFKLGKPPSKCNSYQPESVWNFNTKLFAKVKSKRLKQAYRFICQFNRAWFKYLNIQPYHRRLYVWRAGGSRIWHRQVLSSEGNGETKQHPPIWRSRSDGKGISLEAPDQNCQAHFLLPGTPPGWEENWQPVHKTKSGKHFKQKEVVSRILSRKKILGCH